jgi:hypothetical protein
MAELTGPSVADLLRNRALIAAAIGRAVEEAILTHARAGQPVATWQGGQVVWVPPAEVLARLSKTATR